MRPIANLSISDVVQEIWNLSERRDWKTTEDHNWCLCDSRSGVIFIGRLGIEKYKNAYVSLHDRYKGRKLGFNYDVDLKKVDKWLLECIIKEIPSAKKYTFKFYSVVSILECDASDNELVYTPDFLDGLKFK